MMKKITLVSLFLALLATFSARAQENTYNMVIEMTNGTKINIGPNDIRSLTFNDGQLVVTGGDLQAWMEMVENDINATKAALADTRYSQDAQQEQIYATQEQVQMNADMIQSGEAKIANLEAKTAQIEDKAIENLHMNLQQDEKITILEAKITVLEEEINQLKGE